MSNYRAADQSFVRGTNIASILRYIHEQAPISRARLAALTGLNKSTVSSLVEELLERGLIHETGRDSPGQGRPATLLEINPAAGCILGIELGVDYVRAALVDLSGQILWRQSTDSDPSHPQEQIIRQALELVDAGKVTSNERSLPLLGLGAALPGMVDVQSGMLAFSPNLQWRDTPLARIFHEHTGVPVFVDNDANAGAMGEHVFGLARQTRNFIFVVAGVGIGGGLFLNGELYRGAGGYAGEIGHTHVSSDSSRLCRCGSRGCWENSGNQYALIERVRARLDVGRRSLIPRLCAEQNLPLGLNVIAQAAAQGDQEALSALHDTGEAIGQGIANLINIFNPELIVLGGAMIIVGEYLLPAILETVKEKSLPDICRQTQIQLSGFGVEAVVIGAAALVVEAILSNPTAIAAAKDARFDVNRRLRIQ
jgi:glucokinase-like ROK family protein